MRGYGGDVFSAKLAHSTDAGSASESVLAGGSVEFLIYLILGGFAGTLAGLFGVGGGMIIVPVLVYSFALQGFSPEVLTHMAVGTSLATIVFTSINAVRAHHRLGAVRWPLFVWMTLGIVVGSVLGALTAAYISGPALQKIIGVFAILVAAQMAFKLQPKAALDVPGKPTLTLAGGFIGWASAIFGIGGGSLTVPFLVWRSVPMQQAVATSSACGGCSKLCLDWLVCCALAGVEYWVYLPAGDDWHRGNQYAVCRLWCALGASPVTDVVETIIRTPAVVCGYQFPCLESPYVDLPEYRPGCGFAGSVADPLVRSDVSDRHRWSLVASQTQAT